MSKGQSLQDPFLNTLRKERIPVSIFLVNGIKLQGQIESFDQYVVLLKNTVTQMVYKHAISTVVPARMNSSLSSTAPDGLDGELIRIILVFAVRCGSTIEAVSVKPFASSVKPIRIRP